MKPDHVTSIAHRRSPEHQAKAWGTILGVWAHPDDEAYLSAGVMALARQVGSRVVCVTATKGEAGSPDPSRWSTESIAAVRETELEKSLEVLGVTEHHWLGYRDGHCADEDPDPVVRRLIELLDEVRPDTVLTFGPEGFTDHPDHRAVSGWTSEAFSRWGHDQSTLHFATQTKAWVSRYGSDFVKIGVFAPGTPPAVGPDELSIDVSLPAGVNELKWRALRAQTSQTEGLIQLVGEQLYREAFVQTERFRFA
jgi:LmbE family N-acetylglucosaminyl deacetylase